MESKQSIAFTTTLTEKEWEADVGGWRCATLKIPGAKVVDVFVGGKDVNKSWYEEDYELGIVRWVQPNHPERAAVSIKLTEELSTKELTLRWKKLAIVVPIITAVFAGVFTFITSKYTNPVVNSNTPNSISTCGGKVKISVPVEMQHVPMLEEVKGTFQDLPQEAKIWTMVYPPSIGKFYPQSEAEISGNTWASKVVVGLKHEAGRTFHIYTVIADEKAHNVLNQYARRARDNNESPGMPDLPEGAKICQLISVVRK